MHPRYLAAATATLMFWNSVVLAAEPINLKVLYAGNTGSDRAKDFVSFLEKHFAKVGSADFGKFREADAKDYDVVLFDWTSIYPRNKEGKIDNSAGNITMPPAPNLSPDFTKPTILIGAAGGQVAGTRQLKINWL
jgi:hypothetical protein